MPGEEKEYTVMWDYNIGLTRITPFFKCFKYPKVKGLNIYVSDQCVDLIDYTRQGAEREPWSERYHP